MLQSLSYRLVHRGPDAEGMTVCQNGLSGVAHRRLSIIDLSERAHQPLFNEKRTLALVCNGEIYNHQDLRQELERKGHLFSSDSDNEVVLHLYEEHGPDAVQKLRGMFAFAILNLQNGEIFCARDPFGEKPLFYAMLPWGVAVASEIPAFYGLPGLNLAIDPEAAALFLLRNLRHIPDPWTIRKSIRSLPPGCTMSIADGKVVESKRYWKPDFTIRPISEIEVLGTFDRAVKRCTVANVEIAALLSGGIDSTAITDSILRSTGKSLRTFAFGLNAADPELARARRAAEWLNTNHREIYFDANRQHELFDDLIKRHGQPIAALPLTHAMMLFETIHAEGLKVVMAGHGADEVFYGYDGAAKLATLSKWQDFLPRSLVRTVAALITPALRENQIAEALNVLSQEPGSRKAALYAQEAKRLWPQLMFGDGPDARTAYDWATWWYSNGCPESYIDEAAFLGLVQENAHAITIAGDLPAMAHSIEVRCPFLDRDLVELGLSIRYRDKVTPHGGKAILKRALNMRLPGDILDAPKRGFGYYIQEEAIFRGEWKHKIDAAFADHSDLEGILNPDALTRVKQAFDQQDRRTPAILISKLYALKRFAVMDGAA